MYGPDDPSSILLALLPGAHPAWSEQHGHRAAAGQGALQGLGPRCAGNQVPSIEKDPKAGAPQRGGHPIDDVVVGAAVAEEHVEGGVAHRLGQFRREADPTGRRNGAQSSGRLRAHQCQLSLHHCSMVGQLDHRSTSKVGCVTRPVEQADPATPRASASLASADRPAGRAQAGAAVFLACVVDRDQAIRGWQGARIAEIPAWQSGPDLDRRRRPGRAFVRRTLWRGSRRADGGSRRCTGCGRRTGWERWAG